MLAATYGQVCRRLELIRQDTEDLTEVYIHHWQQLNPVITEALVQLTLGAPQIIYNGGLLHCRLRYFDADRKRPGLPPDAAALVSGNYILSATDSLKQGSWLWWLWTKKEDCALDKNGQLCYINSATESAAPLS